MSRRLTFAIHDLNSWGGHDRSTLEIARRLSHRWPVDVFSYTLDDPKGLESWGEVRFHRIGPDVEHPAALRATWYHGATLPGLALLPALKREEKRLIHATGACSLVSDIIQVQWINAAWKAIRNDLPPEVCAPPHTRGVSGPKAWARRAYHEILLNYNVAIEKRVYSPKKTYIAIARCVAKELELHFGIKKNVHVIHHGVDSEVFAPQSAKTRDERQALRSSLGITEDDVAIAFVGAYERKGLAVAILALAQLSETARKKAKLVAIGSGSSAGFKELAAKNGVAENLVLVGHQKGIERYYRACDAFLLPTLYEPFGLVILEAMACGIAPIVSALAGAAELIVDGKSGLLLKRPTDPKEAALCLERVILDRQFRENLGAEARVVAEKRSWDQVADEYAAVLQPMIEGR